MTELTVVLIINVLLSTLLIIGYRKQIKINRWLCDKLIETLKHNTDAIRELGDDIRQSNITLNMDCLIREYTPGPELTPKELKIDLAKMLAEIFRRATESINKQL